MNVQKPDSWWRVRPVPHGGYLDLDGYGYLIEFDEYEVIKPTPKGAWVRLVLGQFLGDKKFILRDARKRFACPTKEEALESFLKRKERQINILRAQLKEAEKQYDAGLSLKGKPL